MEIKPFANRIWISTPTMHGDEQRFVQHAFDTNWVSTVGENINEFENDIKNKIGCRYAVALSSGTAAIHLALKLADVKPGKKIFCSDLTFVATVNPVIYEKCEPVFIDSEYDTWNMDPAALEKAFEKYPDTRIVIAVHLYGTPAKMDEIREICDRHNAILIEDAAESVGAKYKGVQTGSLGRYNAISFNGNKIITTSGGGMFLTDEKEAADKVRKWATQAKEGTPWYEHTEIGYNYRMSNIIAGIGRGQMLHLEDHIAIKQKIYSRYEEGLKGLPLVMNPYEDCSEPNFWLSCILIDEGCRVTPEDIRVKLDSFNAEARHVWKPMHMQPVFRGCDFISVKSDKAVSADLFERGLCLPSDIKMTEEEQLQIIEIIKSCF